MLPEVMSSPGCMVPSLCTSPHKVTRMSSVVGTRSPGGHPSGPRQCRGRRRLQVCGGGREGP
jgi:hypothetical protein